MMNVQINEKKMNGGNRKVKIISYTMINNEARVLESFVRYNGSYLDKMIFIDNGCTDTSIEILNQLRNEGYSLEIYDESLQPLNLLYIENKYISLIIDQMNPDIVIPLDADEYIVSENSPREDLEKLDLNSIYYIYWKWYVMTPQDDLSDSFIPRRMKYRLRKMAWHYSDGTPVTKVIVPAQYFKNNNLKIAPGHHTIIGKERISIKVLNNIAQAHFRGVSEEQLLEKLYCYSMRDISALKNNYETAQRTNQKAIIEKNSENVLCAAEEASYGGYPRDIVYDPINLTIDGLDSIKLKYGDLANQNLADIVYGTGCEMAIKYYNSEREKRERCFLKPIILWLDGIQNNAAMIPNPSSKETLITAMANVRAYLCINNELRFLKANHRLIVTPKWVKFIPHVYIVVPPTVKKEEVVKQLQLHDVDCDKVITWKEYQKKLGAFGSIWCNVGLLKGLVENAIINMQQNGVAHTIDRVIRKIKGE